MARSTVSFGPIFCPSCILYRVRVITGTVGRLAHSVLCEVIHLCLVWVFPAFICFFVVPKRFNFLGPLRILRLSTAPSNSKQLRSGVLLILFSTLQVTQSDKSSDEGISNPLIFLIHLNTYVMSLRPLEIVLLVQCGHRLSRQNLTSVVEYLCYESATIRNSFTVRGPTLVVRIWRL